MMDMPPRLLGDQLVTLLTPFVLPPPKIKQFPPPPLRIRHLVPKTILEVCFPLGVKRVRFTFDFYVAPDLRIAGFHKRPFDHDTFRV